MGIVSDSSNYTYINNNFARTGYFNDGAQYSNGVYGYYWTKSVNNHYYAYNMRFDAGSVGDSINGMFKFDGLPIRCVWYGS